MRTTKKKFKATHFIDEEADAEEKIEVDNEEDEQIKLMEIEEEKISKSFLDDAEEEEHFDRNLYRVLENARILQDNTTTRIDDTFNDDGIDDNDILHLDDVGALAIEVQEKIKKVLEEENIADIETDNLNDMDLYMSEPQKNQI